MRRVLTVQALPKPNSICLHIKIQAQFAGRSSAGAHTLFWYNIKQCCPFPLSRASSMSSRRDQARNWCSLSVSRACHDAASEERTRRQKFAASSRCRAAPAETAAKNRQNAPRLRTLRGFPCGCALHGAPRPSAARSWL